MTDHDLKELQHRNALRAAVLIEQMGLRYGCHRINHVRRMSTPVAVPAARSHIFILPTRGWA